MAEHRLIGWLHTDPTLVGYAGVGESAERRWERVASGGGTFVALVDGTSVRMERDSPWLVTYSDGELIEALHAFEPLPPGVADAESIKAQLEQQIRDAFAKAPNPGPRRLAGSKLGVEPILLARAFAGLSNWRALAQPEFLDAAPDGYGSSLSFFSHEALRYYLPAYLIADVHGKLERQNPTFHLTSGLTDATRAEPVNPRLYGAWTCFECRQEQFAGARAG